MFLLMRKIGQAEQKAAGHFNKYEGEEIGTAGGDNAAQRIGNSTDRKGDQRTVDQRTH